MPLPLLLFFTSFAKALAIALAFIALLLCFYYAAIDLQLLN
jgi:hypothetical protein